MVMNLIYLFICYNLISKNISNTHQQINKLKHPIKSIKQKGKIILKANKTDNLYTIDVDNYKKKLFEKVTSKYKKATTEIVNNINAEAELIISKNNIKGKIKKIDESNAFITLNRVATL